MLSPKIIMVWFVSTRCTKKKSLNCFCVMIVDRAVMVVVTIYYDSR